MLFQDFYTTSYFTKLLQISYYPLNSPSTLFHHNFTILTQTFYHLLKFFLKSIGPIYHCLTNFIHSSNNILTYFEDSFTTLSSLLAPVEGFSIQPRFSKHQPSGPMLSISRIVRPCVCLFVCLSVLSLFRYHLNVAPTSQSQFFLEIQNPWGKVSEEVVSHLNIFAQK